MITYDDLREFRTDIPVMTETAYQDGLDRLRAEMGPAPRSRSRSRSRKWRYAGVAVAATAACLVAGVVATNGHQPSNAAAAQILEDAAVQAKLKPTLHPAHGQWIYQRIEAPDGGTPDSVEVWIPADAATGRVTYRDSSLPSPSTDDRWLAGAGRLDAAPYDVLAALPTNSSAMIARIKADPCGRPDSSHGPDLAIWSCARSLALMVPPAQQSALFLGLARLRGVQYLGPVTMMFGGRSGVALGMKDPNVGGDIQMVFATGTHEFIGEQIVVPNQSQPEFNSTVVRTAIVNSVLQQP